jgi:hypothetical protein
VTNYIEKCKIIEKYLYNEFGIILNISNNKRKSLIKSEFIINVDFPQELINKYRISDDAIMINISENIELDSKRFSGININYYKIQIPEKYKLDNFNDEIVYESLIYNKKYTDISKRIIKDKIKIKKLIGKNGFIMENEIKNVGTHVCSQEKS